MPEPRRFLLENAGTLVTMNGAREVLTDAWVAAADGLITAIGRGPAPDLIDGIQRAAFDRLRRRAAGSSCPA